MSEFNASYRLKLNPKVNQAEFKKVFDDYNSSEDEKSSRNRAKLLLKQSKTLFKGAIKKRAEGLGYKQDRLIFSRTEETAWNVDRVSITDSGLAKLTIYSNPSSPQEFFELLGLMLGQLSMGEVKSSIESTQVDGVSKLVVAKGKALWGDVTQRKLPSHLKVQGEQIENTPTKVKDFIELVANKIKIPEDVLANFDEKGFLSFVVPDFEKAQPIFDYGIYNEFSRVSCTFWSNGGSHFNYCVNAPYSRDINNSDRLQSITSSLSKLKPKHSTFKRGIEESDRWIWMVSGARYEVIYDRSSLSFIIARP
jgi:hypothetical protein